MSCSFANSPIDASKLNESLANESAGALVTFEGWVRNHNEGRTVQLLAYEAYESLAEKEAKVIIDEAIAKFGVLAARCVHRTGTLEIGELAVWVGVTSRHRKEAFRACEYIIDQIKIRLPIWKKETYADGDSGWVNCQSHKTQGACYESSKR
jgi:molybdopterin synthase catalytic subunit